MGRKNVPVKTNEGAQEIKARALGLAPRIRTALLLVDGVKSVTELERLMTAAGVTPGALQLLLDKGLIRFQEDEFAKTAAATTTDPNDGEAAPAIVANTDAVTLSMVQEPSPAGEIAATIQVADTILAPFSAISPGVEEQIVESDEGTPYASNEVEAPSTEVSAPPAPAAREMRASPPVSPPLAAVAAASEKEVARAAPAALEVVTLLELETILGVATKLEVETILGVATKLELTPTQMLAPKTAVKVPPTEPHLPPLAQAEQEFRAAAGSVPKLVIPASVLRMNLMVARAHLANALDQFLEVEGYALKQKVVACESRADLEQLFRLVEGALMHKMDRPEASRLMGIAYALLER